MIGALEAAKQGNTHKQAVAMARWLQHASAAPGAPTFAPADEGVTTTLRRLRTLVLAAIVFADGSRDSRIPKQLVEVANKFSLHWYGMCGQQRHAARGFNMGISLEEATHLDQVAEAARVPVSTIGLTTLLIRDIHSATVRRITRGSGETDELMFARAACEILNGGNTAALVAGLLGCAGLLQAIKECASGRRVSVGWSHVTWELPTYWPTITLDTLRKKRSQLPWKPGAGAVPPLPPCNC